jgi:hypothetical protein
MLKSVDLERVSSDISTTPKDKNKALASKNRAILAIEAEPQSMYRKVVPASSLLIRRACLGERSLSMAIAAAIRDGCDCQRSG